MMTSEQAKRVKKDWEAVAKEALEIEEIKGVIYAFGSELACLRLAYSYMSVGAKAKTQAKFSVNRNTWFFSLEN